MNLTQDMKKELLSLSPEDLTLSKWIYLLADMRDKDTKSKIPSRYNPTDTFRLEEKDYKLTNGQAIDTTVGRFLYNKYVLEGSGVWKATGYVNSQLDNSENTRIESIISMSLIEDVITTPQYAEYINRRDQFGMQLHAIVCVSFSWDIMIPRKELREYKEELFKKFKQDIDYGDERALLAGMEIEKLMKEKAKELYKDDPAMSLYMSGARGSFDNNFKANLLLKGPVKVPGTEDQYKVIKDSYYDGISKENFPNYSNDIVTAGFNTGIGTQKGGYIAKQFLAVLQDEKLDEYGSDCQSKRPIDKIITKNNFKSYLYRYIVEGDKLVLLDTGNIEKYIGKKVKMRSVVSCRSKNLCNKCVGDLPYKLGIEQIGLTAFTIAGVLTNARLKARHDTSAKVFSIDPDDMLF